MNIKEIKNKKIEISLLSFFGIIFSTFFITYLFTLPHKLDQKKENIGIVKKDKVYIQNKNNDNDIKKNDVISNKKNNVENVFKEDNIEKSEKREIEDKFTKNKFGSPIDLGDFDLTVVSTRESNNVTGSFGLNERAKKGAKFVIVKIKIKNKLKEQITLSEAERFILVDSEVRRFVPNSIIGSDNGILYRNLIPSVEEVGELYYQVPKDVKKYGFILEKEDRTYEVLMNK